MLRRKPSNASEKVKENENEKGQKKKLSLQRSSSFKDFMKPKPSSPITPNKDIDVNEMLQEEPSPVETGKGDVKHRKKWREVITRTITRKTSKMVQSALVEKGANNEEDSLSPVSFDGLPDLGPGHRSSVCSTGSDNTVNPPLLRQISGSWDQQSLDTNPPYNGPFCGRALVLKDFTPSPYDNETLKLQKGDVIEIIEKPPVGTWTGKLNNKVGSFKFIYVTVLPEEEQEEARLPRRRRRGSRSRRPRPQTLEELLERIDLVELSPVLSIHGFESLEDLRGLNESHLNELNVADPDQRAKFLSATAELFEDNSEEDELQAGGGEGETDMPRDSGCFESAENLEDRREGLEPGLDLLEQS